MSAKPVPPVDPISAPFFEACSEGRLTLQQCEVCEHVQFYPRSVCTACGASALGWMEAVGTGVVKSFTVIRRAVSPAFEPDLPYIVALIALTEGPTMMANVVGCAPEAVAVGLRVVVAFERRGEVAIPQFTPA